jgi:UMF1 family MFS transporter
MATAYGDEIGIEITDMMIALIITQFVGIPCSLLFGRLAEQIGAQRSIQIALGVYVLISVAAFFMRTATHFYVLACLVGTVQGGSQALSRSLFGAMVPRHKSAEFFGFFSTSARFAGIAGPVLFGLVSQLTGQSRLGVLALIVFFVLGAALLARVDVAAGIEAARTEEQAMARVGGGDESGGGETSAADVL